MTITSTNKLSAKELLKGNKDIFFSNLVNGFLGDIVNFFNNPTYPSGTTALTQVSLVMFDYDEVVDLTGRIIDGDYLYLPGISNDKVTLKNQNSTHTFTFDLNGDLEKNLNDVITIGDKQFTVKRIGGGLLSVVNTPPIPTYSVSASTLNVNEGDSVIFTITTSNVPNNTTLYWTTSGSTSSADFGAGAFNGAVTVSGNAAIITTPILNDFSFQEGEEHFSLQLRTDSINGPIVSTSNDITVNDTSTASYQISVLSTSIFENELFTFTVISSGIPSGSLLYYTIEGGTASSSDFNSNQYTLANNPLNGCFSTTGTSTSISILPILDFITEGPETFVVKIRTGGPNGSVVATSPVITIQDLVPDVSLSLNSTNLVENGLLICTVTSTNLPNNSILYYSVTGTTSSVDFYSNSGSFIVQNKMATFYIVTRRDGKTEGSENFVVNIRANSISGPILATSSTVTVLDTSYLGKRKNGLTFGPIQVNRDDGNVELASDWYKLCKLDEVPDGSKIALFLDNSGSMTTATVQASYDLLLSKLQERNISVLVITNDNEDWISSFDTFLD